MSDTNSLRCRAATENVTQQEESKVSDEKNTQNDEEVLPGPEIANAVKAYQNLPGDIADVLGNYQARHENGESYEDMAKQVEGVNDHRLARVLRSLHKGDSPSGKSDAPAGRSAGNKAVAADKGKAE